MGAQVGEVAGAIGGGAAGTAVEPGGGTIVGAGGGSVVGALGGAAAGVFAGNRAAAAVCGPVSAPLQSKGGKQNVSHDYILDEARQMVADGQAADICDALRQMYQAASGAKRQAIKSTQKQQGCRSH